MTAPLSCYIAVLLLCAGLASAARADTSADAPAPTASASPRQLGFHAAGRLDATFIDRSTNGPGQSGPESAGFIAGSPLAPNTPYDLFSSAPLVPGVAGISELVSTLTFGAPAFDISVTAGIAAVNGSVTNAAYWGENLFAPLNPHLGATWLPYRVAFPTHAGQDDANVLRAGVLGASLRTADGALQVRGGWFDLAQTDRFVFVQPALTSANPAVAYAPPETVGNGVPSAPWWQAQANALPLAGVDIVAKRGLATLELTNAGLPALPGSSARVSVASLVVDHGEGTRYSAEVAHTVTAGAPFVTTVPFGADPAFAVTPQGVLPTSSLSGQRQTVAGLRAAFHLAPPLRGIDGVAEIGRTWYDADPVALPGTQHPGSYYHGGLVATRGRATASVDAYRMEARYAPLILPYGIPENQWSTAFAWPGQWLKSNAQLIDNSVLGVNRQGYRVRVFVDGGPFEAHGEYTDVRQIVPETTDFALQNGFVDGFFLPQLPAAATLGRQQRAALWLAWHPRFGDLTLDLVQDWLGRPALAGAPQDRVDYRVPQAMLTYARRVSPAVLATAGLGRFGVTGTFAEPIDFAQRLFFTGAEIAETPRAALLITFRRTAFAGRATSPGTALSPNFTSSALIAEQRVRF